MGDGVGVGRGGNSSKKKHIEKKLCFFKLMMDGTCFGPVMFLSREKTGFFC